MGKKLAAVFLGLFLLGVSGCPQFLDSRGARFVPPVVPTPPEPIDFRSGHVSVKCGSATLTAEDPVHVLGPAGTCEATYAVRLSVETNADESMLMDFLQRYVVADWRIQRSSHRVRHELEVYWRPGQPGYRRQIFTGSTNLRPGRMPMIVYACPEGKVGPILACSTKSCSTHSSLGAVPELEVDLSDCR